MTIEQDVARLRRDVDGLTIVVQLLASSTDPTSLFADPRLHSIGEGLEPIVAAILAATTTEQEARA